MVTLENILFYSEVVEHQTIKCTPAHIATT